MKRVLMRTTMAGPAGVRLVHTAHVVEDDEAAALIDGGFATAVDGLESATVEAAERAVLPEARPRRVATKRGRKKVD